MGNWIVAAPELRDGVLQYEYRYVSADDEATALNYAGLVGPYTAHAGSRTEVRRSALSESQMFGVHSPPASLEFPWYVTSTAMTEDEFARASYADDHKLYVAVTWEWRFVTRYGSKPRVATYTLIHSNDLPKRRWIVGEHNKTTGDIGTHEIEIILNYVAANSEEEARAVANHMSDCDYSVRANGVQYAHCNAREGGPPWIRLAQQQNLSEWQVMEVPQDVTFGSVDELRSYWNTHGGRDVKLPGGKQFWLVAEPRELNGERIWCLNLISASSKAGAETRARKSTRGADLHKYCNLIDEVSIGNPTSEGDCVAVSVGTHINIHTITHAEMRELWKRSGAEPPVKAQSAESSQDSVWLVSQRFEHGMGLNLVIAKDRREALRIAKKENVGGGLIHFCSAENVVLGESVANTRGVAIKLDVPVSKARSMDSEQMRVLWRKAKGRVGTTDSSTPTTDSMKGWIVAEEHRYGWGLNLVQARSEEKARETARKRNCDYGATRTARSECLLQFASLDPNAGVGIAVPDGKLIVHQIEGAFDRDMSESKLRALWLASPMHHYTASTVSPEQTAAPATSTTTTDTTATEDSMTIKNTIERLTIQTKNDAIQGSKIAAGRRATKFCQKLLVRNVVPRLPEWVRGTAETVVTSTYGGAVVSFVGGMVLPSVTERFVSQKTHAMVVDIAAAMRAEAFADVIDEVADVVGAELGEFFERERAIEQRKLDEEKPRVRAVPDAPASEEQDHDTEMRVERTSRRAR